MSTLPQDRDNGAWASGAAADPHGNLAVAFDNFVQRVTDELIPELEKSTLTLAKSDALVRHLKQDGVVFSENNENVYIPLAQHAKKLKGLADNFIENCSPPYSVKGMEQADIQAAFDLSGKSVAGMCKLLYRQLQHCRFGDHAKLLQLTKDIVEEFESHAVPTLTKLDLQYYELDKLLLIIEKKLGVEAPSGGAKKERRRRPPKDPDKIETALLDCLRTTIALREKIVNPDREDKFCQLIIRACSEFIEISERDVQLRRGDLAPLVDRVADAFAEARTARMELDSEDPKARGERIEHLLDACVTIQKIGKWVRQVDLQAKELSSSRKKEVLDKFDTLICLARGKDARFQDKF